MKRQKFFTLPDGRNAELFSMRLADGSGVDITNFGGCVVSLLMPSASGELVDVALGWKKPETYLENPGYLGSLVGRVPNRIANGRFTIGEKIYQSCLNDNNRCTLHGGFGFSHRLWDVESATDSQLVLTLFSPDGDAGFPGNLFVRASYRLKKDRSLELEISAECDRLSVADFTNHTYFNLDGENSGICNGHSIVMNADRYTEVDGNLLPTGKSPDVTGTVFDLRNGKSFEKIFAEYAGGLDHNFILGDKDHVYRENVAVVTSGKTGIRMSVHTSRPGIQLYMGSFLYGEGKNGEYVKGGAFCLETQSWPDSVNHPDFPQITIEPGKPFHGITRYEFTTVK